MTGEARTGGPAENLAAARRYIEVIESGARRRNRSVLCAGSGRGNLSSRFFPNGSRDELAGIRAAADRGNKAITRQKYEIKNERSSGDTVALEIVWTGTLAAPLQCKPAGAEMRAHFAAFLQFKDGKIFEQRNYDCCDP